MELLQQPRILRADFLKDPIGFLRDFCNISGKAEDPFIIFTDKIDKAYSHKIENPFNDETMAFDPEWKCKNPEASRFMHIDLGQNKCAAGISSCYASHFEFIEDRESGETTTLPFIVFDFIARIKAIPGEEIKLQAIEDLVYYLSSRGFYYSLITFDRFQSVQMQQRLNERGFTAGYMSVERATHKLLTVFRSDAHPDGIKKVSTNQQHLSAMQCAKDALYAERMLLPFHPVLDKEIREARINRIKNKVVHLPTGSLDLFHSMAGSCFNLVNNVSGSIDNSDKLEKEIADDFYKRYPDTEEKPKTQYHKEMEEIEDFFGTSADYEFFDY